MAGAYNCISRARKYFNEEEVLEIVKTICWHQCLFKDHETPINKVFDTFPTYLQALCRADDDGRITDTIRNSHPIVKTIDKVDTTDPSKPTLYINCGIPGSGKSTISKEFCSNIISTDEVLMELALEEGITNYDEAFNSLRDTRDWVKVAKQRLRDAMHSKKEDITYDACNLTRKGRKSLKNFATQEGFNVVIILVFRDFDECVACRTGEDKNIPMEAYKRMFKSFSYPTKDEYDNLIVRLVK